MCLRCVDFGTGLQTGIVGLSKAISLRRKNCQNLSDGGRQGVKIVERRGGMVADGMGVWGEQQSGAQRSG